MKKLVSLLVATLCFALLLPVALGQEVVNVYNWDDYINDEAIKLFEEETGIKVNYMCFTTNEDMMVQLRNSPGAFDVIVPSDYCVERMLAEDLIQPLNFDNMPNASKYLLPSLQNPAYDPTNAYSVPYMWGTVGILYNTQKVTEEINSWSVLYDEKYKGEVFMLDSIRDSMGVTLKYLGYSLNTRNPKEIAAATNLLIEQKKKGIVKAYQVDETKDKMVLGEAALAVMWSGDAQYAIALNENLAYTVPKEGSNIWIDPFVVPTTATNKENAERFIDFMCRPDIAKLNCEYIWYSSPNTGAIELMGETYTNNSTMNPSPQTIESCEFFNDIQDVITLYNTLWSQIKSAK